jgi:PAS domain S-box-containing protein
LSLDGIIICTILLQLVGAYIAVRMIWITGNRLAWLSLVVAILFMAFKRFIALKQYMMGTVFTQADLAVEGISLFVAVLVIIGLALLVPFFTNMKKTHFDLRDTIKRYRALVELSPDIIILVCEDKIAFINSAGVKFFGAALPEELIGRSIWTIVPAELHSGVRTRMANLLETKGVNPYSEYTLRKPDGSFINMEAAGTYSEYLGNPAIQVIARDITARKSSELKLRLAYDDLEKRVEERTMDLRETNELLRKIVEERVRAEQALRISEEKFRALAENTPDTIMRFDRDHRHVFVNAAVEPQTGIPRERYIGKTHEELGFPENLCRIWSDAIEHVFQTKHPHRIEFGLPKQIWIDWLVIPEFTADGKVETVITSARDITERKRAEEALRESETRFRTLIENSMESIYRTDRDGYFTYINPVVRKMLGYVPEEIVGRHFTDFIHPEWRNRCAEFYRNQFKKQIPETRMEFKALSKSGEEKWVSQAVTLLTESERPVGFQAIVRDITERKRAEEALEVRTQELIRSNKELEQFAYVASHDLQEPLRMVASYVQLLSKRYAGKIDKDADDFIQYASDGALRMQRLINALLEYSRVGTRGGEFKKVSCEEVMNRVHWNLQKMIEESEAVVTKSPLPEIMADESQVLQVLQNLIANAIKFRKEEPPRIHVSAKQEEGNWLFSVEDNGIGIPPEYFERVFEIFNKLHPSSKYSGAGIGLATCKKIMERHKGRIWVESTVGRGSTFFFSIPVHTGEAET